MPSHNSTYEMAQAVADRLPKGLWIAGRTVSATNGQTFVVDDPATQRPIAEVADAGALDAVAALENAISVADAWASTPARTRSSILSDAYRLVIARRNEFAALMSLELGRALPDSHGELAYAAEFLRWFAEEAVRIGGRYTDSPGGAGRVLVTKEAVGPCLAITPWNFPMAMGTRKIGPALAAGNVMIVKPAHETPLTMLALATIFAEVGLLEGVLSVLPTTNPADVAGTLMSDARLRKVSFTGSTPVGRHLLAQAAANVQRTSMELGGSAPFLVFDDADVNQAVEGAFAAKMRNGGEACTAANRFLVHSAVVEEFVDKLTDKMKAVVLGPGYEDGVTLGSLVSRAHQAKVAAVVERALSSGGRLRLGGQTPEGPGYFYPATVIDQLDIDAACTRDEIFGPVALVSAFDDEDEAVAAANSSEFGLAAYFYSRDAVRCTRVARDLKAGMVGVNRGVLSDVAAPFGGVKQSGIGREGGSEGIEEYLATKYVALI